MDTICTTFTDKQNRIITIGYKGPDIVAEHNGKQVACWTFDQYEEEQEGKDLLGVVEMDSAYERAGIGEELLKLAEFAYSDFYVVDHFSNKGAAFFNSCKNKGISKCSHKAVQCDRY